MTTIRYYIPEDGDIEDHPNIFLMSKPAQTGFSPCLRDIKESFPMPGKYHFRFKCPLIPGTDREKGAVSVWMDCVDDDQHVGVWRNTIFAKVTRINMDDDDDEDFAPHSQSNGVSNGHHHAAPVQSAPARRVQQQPTGRGPTPPAAAPAPQVPESDILGVFDAQSAAPAPSVATDEGNLLGVQDSPVESLLDMNGPTYNGNNPSSTHNDFLGMTSTPVSSPPVSGPVPAAPPSYGNPLNNGNVIPPPPAASNNKAFSTFKSNGPFGGLEWK